MARRTGGSQRSFNETISLLNNTALGQEASMYPTIKDIFCDTLGYTPFRRSNGRER